jgi:hypothetical protein
MEPRPLAKISPFPGCVQLRHSDLSLWRGLLLGGLSPSACLYPDIVHVIGVTVGVTEFVKFDAETFAFFRVIFKH